MGFGGERNRFNYVTVDRVVSFFHRRAKFCVIKGALERAPTHNPYTGARTCVHTRAWAVSARNTAKFLTRLLCQISFVRRMFTDLKLSRLRLPDSPAAATKEFSRLNLWGPPDSGGFLYCYGPLSTTRRF